MTKTLKFWMMSFAILFCTAPLLAQVAPPEKKKKLTPPTAGKSDELPTAESILTRYIEVTGGEAAHRAVKTRTMEGKFEIPSQGMSGPMKLTHKAPSEFQMSLEIPGVMKETTGVTNGTAWSTNPMTGPRLLKDSERNVTMREARLHRLLDWKKLYKSVKTLRMEEVKGEQAYAVEIVAEGKPFLEYYSKDSGLMVKTSGSVATPMGEISFDIFMSDYREVDGVKYPFLITRMQMGMEIKATTTKIEHNVELAADALAIPADVQTLMKKDKGEEAGEKDVAGEKEPKKGTPKKAGAKENPEAKPKKAGS